MFEGELLLLRHGRVASHRGDVPLTDEGEQEAEMVGNALGNRYQLPVLFLSSRTLRARQTMEALARGITAVGGHVADVRVNDALRNPDLYVGGQRVDMVSSLQALAEQVSGLDAAACMNLPFWSEFISHPDRIGYWLEHPDPPGDDRYAVARRVLAGFARTLFDSADNAGRLVVAVTHSPLLRACAIESIGNLGEPRNLTGLRIAGRPHGEVSVTKADPLAEVQNPDSLLEPGG